MCRWQLGTQLILVLRDSSYKSDGGANESFERYAQLEFKYLELETREKLFS